MKNIITTSLLASLISIAGIAMAEGAMHEQSAHAEMKQEAKEDPTVTFFRALAQCNDGSYYEKNLLSASVGDEWLNQKIVGLDEQGYCHATLQTPDGRRMECYFDPYDLADVGTARFLNGILDLDTNPNSKRGLTAERQWSQLKDQNCGFDDH